MTPNQRNESAPVSHDDLRDGTCQRLPFTTCVHRLQAVACWRRSDRTQLCTPTFHSR
jgi:hypothetical protein